MRPKVVSAYLDKVQKKFTIGWEQLLEFSGLFVLFSFEFLKPFLQINFKEAHVFVIFEPQHISTQQHVECCKHLASIAPIWQKDMLIK